MSYHEENSKQVQDIGDHCTFQECNRLDFLPIKCDLCLSNFCREHAGYSYHNCPNFKEKLPTNDQELKPINFYKCTFSECNTKEIVQVICEFCKFNFCMKHRLQIDHNCIVKLEEDKKRDEEMANKKQPKEIPKFEIKQNVSDKNASLAAKLLLMKLKQTAIGPPGLTDDLKYFFYVEYESSKKPFYFSIKWPIGRCLEFVFDKLNIPKSSKLRFFIQNDQLDLSLTIEEAAKSLPVISQGITLLLKQLL